MNYRRNEDKWPEQPHEGPCYNPVLDVKFIEDSGEVTEPVTVAEFKTFAGIEIDGQDDAIEGFITTARQIAEDYTAVGFIRRQLQVVVDNCNGGIFLPYGPDIYVSEVKNEDDTILTTDGGYELSGDRWKQLLEPRDRRIQLTYEGGFTELPQQYKTALLNIAMYLYDSRGTAQADLQAILRANLNRLTRNV
jgi:uncharacterized phiE125 gp8 family phage protein